VVSVSQSLRTLDLAFNSLGNSLTTDAVTALGKALAANGWVRTKKEHGRLERSMSEMGWGWLTWWCACPCSCATWT
jgi:hypothetical protein